MHRAAYVLLVAVIVGGVHPVMSRGIAQQPIPPLHEGWVTSVGFAGKWILCGGGQSLLYRPGFVRGYDLSNGQADWELKGAEANVWSVAARPDGSQVVAATYDGKLLVWDVATQQLRHTLAQHKGWVRCVTANQDGSRFASCGEDGQVIVWNADSWQPEKAFKAHEGTIYQVVFSPDGERIATAAMDKTARIWNWRAVEQMAQETLKLEGHEEAVWTVAFAPSGWIATGGADRKIRVWNPEGQLQKTLEGHRDWISRVVFSPDGTLLAASDLGRTVRVWNVEQGQVVQELSGFTGSVWCVAFSADGRYLAAGSHKNGARLWTTSDWKEVFPAPAPASTAPTGS